MDSEYYRKGKERFKAKEYKQAMEYLQAAIEEDLQNAEAYLLLADCYVAIGKEKQALSSLHQLLAIDPSNKKGISKLQRLSPVHHPSPQIKTSPKPNNPKTPNSKTSSSNNPGIPPKRQNTQQQSIPNSYGVTPGGKGDYYDFRLEWTPNFIFFKKTSSSELEVVEPIEHGGWVGYNKPVGKVSIPPYLNWNGEHYRVTSIGSDAFKGCTDMSEVVIPGTIKSIISNAFEYCSSLKEVMMPNSVTILGKEVFKNCLSLEKAVMSENITNYYEGVFDGCTNLRFLKLGKGMKSDFLRLNKVPSDYPDVIQDRLSLYGRKKDATLLATYYSDDSKELNTWIKLLLVLSGIAIFVLFVIWSACIESNFLFVLAVLVPCQYIYWSVEWYDNFQIKLASLSTSEKRSRRKIVIWVIIAFWVVVTLILILTKPFSIQGT